MAREDCVYALIGGAAGNLTLTSRYDIVASRLEAGGVGPLAPVATDDTEEGKLLNRAFLDSHIRVGL